MQSLLKHPKRQFVISRKLVGSLFKYDARKYGIIKATSSNIKFNSAINRLCFPLSCGLYTKVYKELNQLQLFLKNDFCKSSKLCNPRNFSSTTSSKQSSKGSSESSEDPGKDSKRPNEFQILLVKFAVGFLVALSVYRLISLQPTDAVGDRINWNDFINEILLKGQVQEIRIYPKKVQVVLKRGATYKGKLLFSRLDLYNIPDSKDIEEKIRLIERRIGIKMEDGIPIRYISFGLENILGELFRLALVIGLIAFFARGANLKNGLNSIFSDLRKAKFTLVDPFSGKGVHFSDVAGLKEAKIEVMEFVDYLKNPERYRKLGAKVPKGALLLGPPGCGKTLLAKAVATESNVPFLSMNGSEFIEIVGGLGAVRVRDLFAEAKKRAPSIIYIDEIDAIGKKRSEGIAEFSNSESERTLNQLLVEMDGMTTSEDIIILASTNRADVLDKALLRPGRFDRHILIDLPTLEEREQIFEYHLKSLVLEGSPSQYSKYLAHLTPGFSGAEIANVCNEAALHAASNSKTKVENIDLMYAIDKILGGTVKKSSTLTPSEKKVVVYHEAGHALAAWLLEHIDPLIKVTVIPRTNKRLGFTQYSDSNLKLRSVENLFQNMCVLLGGRVAENIIFNKISTRAQNDLKKVTEMAYRQVQQFGMSPAVGLISFNTEYTTTKTKKPYSKKMASIMDSEVRRIITEAYKTTEKLLLDNKDKLIILAEALLKNETLTYKDIEKLIGPPPFGKKDVMEVEELNLNLESKVQEDLK